MSKKLTALTEATSVSNTDLVYVLVDPAGSPLDRKVALNTLMGTPTVGLNRIRGLIADPNTYQANIRAVIPIFRTDAAITITRIHIHGPDSTPGSELDIDLKWADDIFDGSFANAAVIDVCDTTSGAVTITAGFDDATVASGKYIYWSFGAQPHADWLDIWFEIYYTYD